MSMMRDSIQNVKQHGYGSFRTDLFGRIKTADAFTLFDSSHRYQRNDDFSETTANGATVTYVANQSTLNLNVTTASGSKVTLESKKVFPYQPGKSLQVMQTFVFAPPKANLRQRAGYFSRQNGVYLEQDGTNVYLVKRTFKTGEVAEERVAQADWNIDPLNGSGMSDIVLDLTKGQILFSEYEWLGIGSVRIGFAIDGYFIPVHQFNHANRIDSVYMTTATLPVRYEIENTGTTASASTMKQVCVSVISNGGYQRQTERWTASRGSTSVSTTYYPLVSIRLAPGRTDSVIMPANLGILPTGSGNFEWALMRNSVLADGTWDLHVHNNVEYCINSTSFTTAGVIVREGFFAGSNQSTGSVEIYEGIATFDLQLGRSNADTPVSDILTLAVKTVSGSTNILASLGWFDLV